MRTNLSRPPAKASFRLRELSEVGPWLTSEGVNTREILMIAAEPRSASPWRAAGIVEKHDVGFYVGA